MVTVGVSLLLLTSCYHYLSGTDATYSITVADATDIKKGDYAEGAGIPANTYVVDIQGLVIEISQQLTATANAGTAVSFGRGRTTASYPEQVFTFTSAAGSVYGYYLARANNMPVTLHGVLDGGSVAAGTQITRLVVRVLSVLITSISLMLI